MYRLTSNFSRLRRLFSCSLVLAACASFPATHSLAESNSNEDIYDELKAFTDVLAIVKRDYVRNVSDRELVEGAIKGMLTTLDPHSSYLNPDFYKDLKVQTKGEFGGLGIEITLRDGLLTIVAPMEGSPAMEAGVMPGDIIVKIDGKFTKDFTLADAVKKLRGPRGSKVIISVTRKGAAKLIDIPVKRDRIKVDSVKHRYLGEGLGYLRVSQFMEQTADDIIKALDAMNDRSGEGGLKGLVIDLRNNPGGLLTQAVRVSDLFLEEGVVVYTQGRVESQKQKFFAHQKGTQPEYPIVVMVNGGSASASEILAGAIKDHGRGVVLGTQTFGKGSVQTITPLENGGALTLTTALYYTKSGNSLQATGVAPDITVKDELDLERDGKEIIPLQIKVREEDLPGAISNPDGAASPLQEINQTPTIDGAFNRIDPEEIDIAEWKQRDRQFTRAISVLKSFDEMGRDDEGSLLLASLVKKFSDSDSKE